MRVKDKIGFAIILFGAIPIIVCILNGGAIGYTSIPEKLPNFIADFLALGNLFGSFFIMIFGAIILWLDQHKKWLEYLSICIILLSFFWQYYVCKTMPTEL